MRWRVVVVLITVLAGACTDDGGGSDRPAARPARPHPAESPELELAQSWAWLAPPPASAGMPAADDQGVALTSGHEHLVLLDGGGAVQWVARRTGLRDVAPLLTPDAVVAATDDGVVAYQRAGGRLRWEATLGERANTPVAAQGRVVVTTWEGSVVALDVTTGRVAWRERLGGDALGPAAAVAEVVVASFDTGREAGVVGLDAASGRQRWSAAVPANGVSAPAVVEPRPGEAGPPTAVVVAGDASARGLSLADGSQRWRRPLEGAGSPEVPPLARDDGTVVVGHRQGGLALLEATDGSVRWEASSEGAAVRGAPAGPGPRGWWALPLDDGRVLFAGPDRDIDLRTPPVGLVTGIAAGPGGVLLVATGQGEENGLLATTGW